MFLLHAYQENWYCVQDCDMVLYKTMNKLWQENQKEQTYIFLHHK